MDIISAIKSGKPFSRTDWAPKFYTLEDRSQPMITPKEAIDDKWIIQEKTISITESQFDELWDKYLNKSFNKDDLKKELGL